MDCFWTSFDNPQGYQVVIEADERVAYAYLLKDRQIVSDVWLFNRVDAPVEPEWERKDAEPPYANTRDFAIPFEDATRVVESDFRVMFNFNASPVSVGIYCRDRLLAIMVEGVAPGKSMCAATDSPVAKSMGSAGNES